MMSYPAHAAWPLVETGVISGDAAVRDAGARVLGAIAARRNPDGSYRDWGFEEGQPAFTHTIAYTIWGLLAGADALRRWGDLARPALPALDRLAGSAQRLGGALPGAFGPGWSARPGVVCPPRHPRLAPC